jgi:hypothetical protein
MLVGKKTDRALEGVQLPRRSREASAAMEMRRADSISREAVSREDQVQKTSEMGLFQRSRGHG